MTPENFLQRVPTGIDFVKRAYRAFLKNGEKPGKRPHCRGFFFSQIYFFFFNSVQNTTRDPKFSLNTLVYVIISTVVHGRIISTKYNLNSGFYFFIYTWTQYLWPSKKKKKNSEFDFKSFFFF